MLDEMQKRNLDMLWISLSNLDLDEIATNIKLQRIRWQGGRTSKLFFGLSHYSFVCLSPFIRLHQHTCQSLAVSSFLRAQYAMLITTIHNRSDISFGDTASEIVHSP